jgi:hypothetical protein
MGRHELSPELAEHVVKQGEVRNPLGISDVGKRRRNYEIRRLLMAEANEPSKIPGYEHLTKMQVGVSTLMDLYQHGVQWAVKEVHNRLFGRVPLDVNATITPQSPTPDLDELTDEELTARAEELLARMRALPAAPPADVDALDGVVVENETDDGKG